MVKTKLPRLWSCEVHLPIDEIAIELKLRIGHDLTEEERCRFGFVDIIAPE